MLGITTAHLNELSSGDDRKKEAIAKRKIYFHNGREPENLPRIKFDINDYEFTDMLREMDVVYEAVHNLNATFVKYSSASTSKNFI